LDWCKYLLEGKNVNLRVMEKEDLDFFVECHNDVTYYGEEGPIMAQMSKAEAEKRFENPPPLVTLTERGRFVIEKKDGARIGFIAHYFVLPSKFMEIGYDIIPSERSRGHGTEAVQIMVDYLFLSKDVARIQAVTNVGNKASQRVLEKASFKKEGTLRKVGHVRGESTDAYIYSILREEWKEPKILTKTA
jgi:RimJ/RimL family protein N-acetyltransferase